MLDLSNKFLPLASFIIGLSGSLHCVGMCGGLVIASCNGGKDVLKYQVGRLLGYSIMGSITWMVGHTISGVIPFQWGTLFAGIFMGLLFIYWGVQSYKGQKAELPLPSFLHNSYRFLFRRYASKAQSLRSFIIGLISIMLPCGLIYGLIIASLALGSYEHVMASLLFFWLGTLPAMIGAPHIVKKILNPMKSKLPKAYAFLFIFIGMVTIAGRLNHLPEQWGGKAVSGEKVHKCH